MPAILGPGPEPPELLGLLALGVALDPEAVVGDRGEDIAGRGARMPLTVAPSMSF